MELCGGCEQLKSSDPTRFEDGMREGKREMQIKCGKLQKFNLIAIDFMSLIHLNAISFRLNLY